jgi:hypothetical protein
MTLLKAGPQTGTVLSTQSAGKAVVSFMGKPFPVETKGLNLQPGQQVLAQLVGDKLLLQVVQQQGQPQAGAEGARSLSAQLANLGLTQPQAQAVAQAFLKAGIPLEQTALKDLSTLLSSIQSNQSSALSMLLSRGLPVNPAILTYFFQVFAPKPKPSTNLTKLMNTLKKAEKKLDEDGEDDLPITPDDRRQLKDRRRALEQEIPSLRQLARDQGGEELPKQFQNALASPEANLINRGNTGQEPLSASLVRLLSLLIKLEAALANTQHQALFQSLVQDTKDLHQQFIAQAVKNLPRQTGEPAPNLFVQIPYMEDGEIKDFEAHYQERSKDKKSGKLDLRFDLTNLGPIRASIQWEHPNISVTLTVTENNVENYLTEALGQLNEMLTQKGFHVVSLNVQTGDIPQSLAEEVEEEPSLPAKGLDLKA